MDVAFEESVLRAAVELQQGDLSAPTRFLDVVECMLEAAEDGSELCSYIKHCFGPAQC